MTLKRPRRLQDSVAVVVFSMAVASLLGSISTAEARHGDRGDCEPGDKDCAAELPDPPISGGTTLRYADVAAIIEKKCAKCHSPGEEAEFLPFVTKDDVMAMRDLMFYALNTGYMPRNDPEWRYSRKGLQLQAWLKNGQD